MKQLVTKALIAGLGLVFAAAPLAASAQSFGVRVNVGGVRAGYWHPAPAPPPPRVVYYDGYYGPAPAGYYGYYWRGRWFHHRRWHNGVWVYF